MYTPKCIRDGNPCITHNRGHYIKYKCGIDTKEFSRNEKIRTKHKCISCDNLVGRASTRCKSCSNAITTKERHELGLFENFLASARGENNYTWKGDDVGYYALHIRIRRNWGIPEVCDSCGKVGECGKGGKWNIQWANKTGKYLYDREDWLRLCKKCHIEHDKNQDSKKFIYKGKGKMVRNLSFN